MRLLKVKMKFSSNATLIILKETANLLRELANSKLRLERTENQRRSFASSKKARMSSRTSMNL
jgi:hypothetical protein